MKKYYHDRRSLNFEHFIRIDTPRRSTSSYLLEELIEEKIREAVSRKTKELGDELLKVKEELKSIRLELKEEKSKRRRLFSRTG